MPSQHVLEVQGLTVEFRSRGGTVRALSDASFHVDRGEVLVVIGESGSGKTVLAHALMDLLPMNARITGSVRLLGQELVGLPEKAMRQVRGRRIALIPQGAGSALNPVRRIGSLLTESARARGIDPEDARRQFTELFADLGLSFDEISERYPHQLSGGMQQRVVNVLAMLGTPDVVIADEPTSGLDSALVETTASHLQRIAERGSALIVITHDLRLAERLGGRLALVYGSYLVELQPTASFFAGPAHPYGRGLLEAMPERGSKPIPGVAPELTDLPPGCPFAPRCTHRRDACSEVTPRPVPLAGDGNFVRCLMHA